MTDDRSIKNAQALPGSRWGRAALATLSRLSQHRLSAKETENAVVSNKTQLKDDSVEARGGMLSVLVD